MSQPQVDKSSVDSLKFNGKSLHFAAWKSKLIIHLRALSEQRALEELQHKRAKPLTRFEDLLESQPELPPRPAAADKEATCLSNAAGVVGLVQQFLEMVNADFKSVNMNAHEALHTHMITSKMMLVMVSFTEESFTLEKVSEKLANIFGNKTKSEIMALASGRVVNHVKSNSANGISRRTWASLIGPSAAFRLPRTDPFGFVGSVLAGVVVAVDACDPQQDSLPATPDGYTSPPPSNFQQPDTPGKGASPMSDEDEPMESVVNAVKADASGTAPAAAKQSDDDVDMEGGQQSRDSRGDEELRRHAD
ncbi:hypothetical protein PHYSODRAFT_339429 [Phytophthora sojae]|uniref:Uncharacterized protein n=1 Tax=Phytophthora sojae (strain P6497) TaxID=1094619 RepID=G5A6U6_PHYSP|nr:hypothetical protein PHYSODRAFT_339429 [Phytophthora sojae]EGZ09051.1 hypothetical protein PHYSODRAFT_339429 [Phytophthora sojae]|eukprot:XP_009535684.1 hypothetical protein PHYSODRAFT_339429 [Phytophthora sojae]